MLQVLTTFAKAAIAVEPAYAASGAALAAAVVARKGGPIRWAVALTVIAGTWYVAGGGAAVALVHGGALAAGMGTAELWASSALAAVAGCAWVAGIPAGAGAFVGRRVTLGTGWASAAVIAATVALAFSSLT